MKKITAVLAFMCALSAYASYPSAAERQQSARETLAPMAMMQMSRMLPNEACQAT